MAATPHRSLRKSTKNGTINLVLTVKNGITIPRTTERQGKGGWLTPRVSAFMRVYGSELDPLGNSGGKYLAVMRDNIGDSFESRSLPLASLLEPYNSFRLSGVLPRGWSLEISEVSPGFGRYGGSLQVLVLNSNNVSMTIEQMDDAGMFLK